MGTSPVKKQEELAPNLAALKIKSSATREKLLNTAEELFVERGFDIVSISEITKAAGLTKGHIYYYFKTKQELFNAVLERYFASYIKAFEGAVNPEDDIRTQLHSAIDAYLDLVEQNPGYPRLVQREVCTSSKNIDQIVKGLNPLYQWIRGVLRGVLPENGPRSVRHFFMSFMGIAINYYTYSPMTELMWGVDPMSKQELSERRQHVHMVLDSLVDRFIENGDA